MRWNYVFWDWNGTIVDDLQYNHSIVNDLLIRRKKKTISIDEYREKFGFPIKAFYQEIGFDLNDLEYSQIADEYRVIYESHMDEISISEGIIELMAFFHEHSIEQVIFTSCNKDTLLMQLQMYPTLLPLIDDIICQDNNLGTGKYDLALKWERQQVDFEWRKAVIIGDTYYEKTIAEDLGCDCILINSGHQKIMNDNSFLSFDNTVQLAMHKEVFID